MKYSDSMHQFLIFTVLILTFSILPTPILLAQENGWKAEAIPVNLSSFNETLDPLPDVSGSPLVGLRMGDVSGNINTNNINLVIPPTIASNICIASKTKDGRFSSENPYRIKIVSKDAKIARVRPFTNNKKRALELYSFEDLAIRAFQSPAGDCIATGAIHLPQVMASSKNPDTLSVLINAGSRLTKGMLSYVESVNVPNNVYASCGAIEGKARLSFDTICRFSSLHLHTRAEANLLITLDDGFGEEKHSFKILLPQTDE